MEGPLPIFCSHLHALSSAVSRLAPALPVGPGSGHLANPSVDDLEYGTDTIEIQADAIEPGQRVVLLDDLLATGGTMAAAARLLSRSGADVQGAACLIELAFLDGRAKLDIPITTLVSYDS